MTDGIDAEPIGGSLRLALFALTIGSFGIGTSEFSSMGLLQLFAADLGISLTHATDAITIYAMGVVVGGPLVTIGAARLNRRTLLILLMALFIVGNLVTGLAHSVVGLEIGRFLSGMPQGAFFGAGAYVATHIVGAERGGKAFAIVVSGLTVATIVGAPAGTWIGQHFGWRAAYLTYAAYGVVAVIALVVWLPRSGRLDGSAITQELSALVKWRVWAMIAITALSVSSVFALYTFIGPLVTDIAHLSSAMIPVALALYGLGMALGTVLGGWVADRYAFGGIVIGFAITLGVLVILGLTAEHPIMLMACLFVAAFTIQIAIPSIPVRMTAMAPDSPSLIGALNMAAFNIANAIGASAAGISVGAGFGLLSVVWTGLALTSAGLLLYLVLAGRLASRLRHPVLLH